MIQEAPMWLLLPIAGMVNLLYFGVVLAERRERADVDRCTERREQQRRAEQVTEDQAAVNGGSHGRMVHP